MELEIPRCPRCKSTQSYHRAKDNTRRCRVCGKTWSAEKKSKVKDRVKTEAA